MSRRALALAVGAALTIASAAAHAGGTFYTVHPATLRFRVAVEECNGECHIRYVTESTRDVIRSLCGILEVDPVPRNLVLAMFIACEEFPSFHLGVWDKDAEDAVCDELDFELISAAHEEAGEDRGRAETLHGGDLGFGPIVAGLARYGPLPRRLEAEDICWLNYRSSTVTGAFAPDNVITKGSLRGGSPIGLYFSGGD